MIRSLIIIGLLSITVYLYQPKKLSKSEIPVLKTVPELGEFTPVRIDPFPSAPERSETSYSRPEFNLKGVVLDKKGGMVMIEIGGQIVTLKEGESHGPIMVRRISSQYVIINSEKIPIQ